MLSMVYFHCKTIRNAAAKSVILGRKNQKKEGLAKVLTSLMQHTCEDRCS